MKILLAGGASEAAALLEALAHASDHEITHCMDDARAIIDLLKNGYDWAIIDGRVASGGEKDGAPVVRAMGSRIPADYATAGQTTSCGVEWSREGILQLHCRMHSILRENPLARPVQPGSPGDMTFEYHAPCGKEQKPHG